MKRVLIIRPDALGDFISIIPVIRSLKKAWPDCFISVLGSNNNKEISSFVPELDEFINIADYIEAYDGLIKFIRAKAYNIALVYNHIEKWALLPLRAGIKIRIGDKYRGLLRFVFNKGVYINNSDHSKHVIEYNLQYLRCLNINDFDFSIKIDSTKYHTQWQMRLILQIPSLAKIYDEKNVKQDWIVLHIGKFGGSGGRLWTPENYARIINELSCKNRYILLTGQSMFQEFNDKVIRLVNNKENVIELISKTSIPQLIAVLMQSSVYIGTDTGVTHLAAACGCPSVYIMGVKAIKPIRWYSWGVPVKVVYNTPHCPYTCNFSTCQKDDCLHSINVDQIINGANDLLANKPIINDAFAQSISVAIITNRSNEYISRKIEQDLTNIRVITINYFNIFHIKKFWDMCIKEDITVIHFLPFFGRMLMIIINNVLPISLFVKPLLIIGKKNISNLNDVTSYLKLYQEKFNLLSVKANKKFWVNNENY